MLTLKPPTHQPERITMRTVAVRLGPKGHLSGRFRDIRVLKGSPTRTIGEVIESPSAGGHDESDVRPSPLAPLWPVVVRGGRNESWESQFRHVKIDRYL